MNMTSEITFTYKSFTSRVCWDNVKCFWFIGWIYDKDYFNIFKEPPYILTGKYIQELQPKFEEYIDNYLKQMKKEEKEIPLFMQHTTPKENLKNLTDQDVALVKEFIASLDKIANEMELLEEDEYSGTVLTVKLKRVYDEYKDKVMPSSSFESFIDYYSYLQSKKEEEKKEIAHKEFHEELESMYSEWLEDKFRQLYEQYSEVLDLTFEEIKKYYFDMYNSK